MSALLPAAQTVADELPAESRERKRIALQYLEMLAAADWEAQKRSYTAESVFYGAAMREMDAMKVELESRTKSE